MPRIARSGDRLGPDIVLGDRYGTTCAPAIIDLVETVFTSAGLKVTRNRPYAGGYATRTYGRPQYGVHALQIEISRHLYMNEVTLDRGADFDAVRALIERLIFALIGMDIAGLRGALPDVDQEAAE
jgi:N-formylglutamate amidohydrolase